MPLTIKLQSDYSGIYEKKNAHQKPGDSNTFVIPGQSKCRRRIFRRGSKRHKSAI